MFKLWPAWVCTLVFAFGLNAANIDSHFDKAPLAFEPNQGQWSPRTGFGVHGQGFVAGFSGRDVEFSLKGKSAAKVRMRWQGADGGVHLAPAEDLGGVSNYYRGSDSSKWISKVPHYRKLRVDGLYPGINLIYYGQGRELEYDLEVAPGADPRKARLQFDGATALRLDERGDLVIETIAGNLVQHKPVAYQVSGGQRVAVAANYRLRGRSQVSIEVGPYDRTRPLVVDPTIAWGQSFGSTSAGSATGVAVDGSGNVYLTGFTAATDFPLVNPVDNTQGCPSFCDPDAFLMKLSPDGATILFSTFLGGSLTDLSQSIALDGAGNVYIAGYTYSNDFPTKSPYQASLSGAEDVFLAKFTTSGTLTYATYLGGAGQDAATALVADSSGNAYLTGSTTSVDFPTVGAYQTAYGQATDAFVTKVSADGSALLFSTYLGGASMDTGNAIALGAGGTVYVAGITTSSNFPTKNAVQSSTTPGADTAFVTQLDSTGATLVYSTFLGTGGAAATGLDVDATGAAYIVGWALNGFPLKNSMQAFMGIEDAFVTKLSPDGSSLVYSTYLGGTGDDSALAVKVNSSLNAIVMGFTSSSEFPTLAALDPMLNSENGFFVAQLNASGSALVFSTFLGGTSEAQTAAVALDSSGAIYVAGQTDLPDFPTQAQKPYGAPFVVKLAGGTMSIAVTVTSVPAGLNLSVDGNTVQGPRSFQWAPGVSHQLYAVSPIATAGPDVNNFVSWSNGGGQTQTVITPVSATTYTATYSTQACVFSFSLSSQTVGQAGSFGNFMTVTTQAGCPWTAAPSAPWITGSFQGTGPGVFQYEIAANTGGGTRTGTIKLGSATFTVTQENMTPTVSYNMDCCSSQSGLSQTFQISFSDADGATDLSVSNILFNNFLDGRQACYLALDHQAKVLYLVGDSGGGLTGMSLSNGQGSGVISNSQCAVDGTKTFISQQGTTATLTLGLDFTLSFGGNKVMYLASRDMEENNSGWVPSGTWGVPAAVVYPEVVSGSSESTSQTDTFNVSVTYRDATTSPNLSPVQILINDYLNGANACYFGYDHTHNLLYLLNDAGSTLLPAITPGVGMGTQQNSQCVVFAQNSSVQQNGTDLTLNLNLFFLPGFRGHRIVYAATQTITNGNSGWQAIGAIDIQ